MISHGLRLIALTLVVACADAPPEEGVALISPAPAVAPAPTPAQPPALQRVRVIASYPRSDANFTQGLFFADGLLYETTGRVGQSRLIRHGRPDAMDPTEVPLPGNVFGEGATAVDDRIISLTWRDGVGHVHDRQSLELARTFPVAGEGWGLAYDGQRLIVSDGSNRLRFLDPDSFAETGSLAVTANGRPVTRLNELEVIDGEIWANIWQTDVIARIDAATGEVRAFIDLSGLHPNRRDPSNDVLNGIAFDPATRRLFVTGKLWPAIYEIEVTPVE